MKLSNNEFYSSLVTGKTMRETLGLQKRFSYEHVINNPSVKKYLLPFLNKYINHSDVVLDYGCGAGILLPIISPFCKEVHGFDVVPAFVDMAKGLLKTKGVKNGFVYNDNEFKNKFLVCDAVSVDGAVGVCGVGGVGGVGGVSGVGGVGSGVCGGVCGGGGVALMWLLSTMFYITWKTHWTQYKMRINY